MPNTDVIRAWKDVEYRERLSSSELAGLPGSPAGPLQLRDEQLDMTEGCNTVSPSCQSVIRCTFESC